MKEPCIVVPSPGSVGGFATAAQRVSQAAWDVFYLNMARYVSTKSKDPSTRTGAVLVRPDWSLCSIGYNGFAQGMNDDPALYADRDKKYSRIVHCEMNATLLSHDSSHNGYILYTWPFASCDRCAVHMVQAGIKRFVFPSMPADKAARWGTTMETAQSYMREAQCVVVEVPLEDIPDVWLTLGQSGPALLNTSNVGMHDAKK